MVDFFPGSSTNAATANSSIHKRFASKKVYKAGSSKLFLSSLARKKMLENIEAATAPLPKEYYDSLYKELIDNFVAFVQILPTNNEAKLASLMEEGLMRALYAVQMQQKANKDEIDLVLPYVIFSAALLYDVGCVIENRTVIVSEKDGSFIKIWDPLHDGAIPEDMYYKIRHGGGLAPWSSRRSVIALACNLMPRIGFNWIYKNSHIFNIWLALLADDKEGSGALRFSFERAQELLEGFKNSDEYFMPLDLEEIESEPKETLVGEEFCEWLNNEALNGKVTTNVVGADLFLIEKEDRTILSEKLIKRYADKNGVPRETVKEQLEKLKFIGEREEFVYAKNAREAAKRSSPSAGGASLFGTRKASTLNELAKNNHDEAGDTASKVNINIPIIGYEIKNPHLVSLTSSTSHGFCGHSSTSPAAIALSAISIAAVGQSPQDTLARQINDLKTTEQHQQLQEQAQINAAYTKH